MSVTEEELESIREEILEELDKCKEEIEKEIFSTERNVNLLGERITELKEKVMALEELVRLMAAIQLRNVPLTAFSQKDLIVMIEELRKKVDEL